MSTLLKRVPSCARRYKRSGVHRRPKRLPRGLLSWIVAVYKIKQEEVIEVAGYDAATYMRILTMGAACEECLRCLHSKVLTPALLRVESLHSVTTWRPLLPAN